MPSYLTHEHLQAAAALVEKNFEKPAGVVTIEKIAIYSTEINTFAKVTAYLYDRDGKYFIPIGNNASKVAPHLGTVPAFIGPQSWPHDWRLYVACTTQAAASIVKFIIEYNIEPPIKKGWGA